MGVVNPRISVIILVFSGTNRLKRVRAVVGIREIKIERKREFEHTCERIVQIFSDISTTSKQVFLSSI